MKGTLGTTEGDGAAEDGDTGRDDRPMSPLDTDGTGDGQRTKAEPGEDGVRRSRRRRKVDS